MKKIEEKMPFIWLILGLILAVFSYGIFNTGICAWIFAIPLLRYLNIRLKWSSILWMLLGLIIVGNITFFGIVQDGFNIMNQVFATLNGIRIWFPFFIYFICRKFNARKLISYFIFPCSVVIAEFFIDNPFISVMTSLSVSQFWNIGLMQLASVTGVTGVSFVVTLAASIFNYVWEEKLSKKAIIAGLVYCCGLVLITGIGMSSVTTITRMDETVRVAAGVENINFLGERVEDLQTYSGNVAEKITQANLDIIKYRAIDAANNEAAILVFPEDAFFAFESKADKFIDDVKNIAKDNNVNILLPLLRLPEDEISTTDNFDIFFAHFETYLGGSIAKKTNTLNFIDKNGQLLYTYTKNHLVPVVEEPTTNEGDGKTPIVEVDGIKYTFLICADYTSNKYAYNGREADVFLNPSYDWEAFQYFTSYGVQARAIECGFSVLRNPVNGNIVLYDYFGRPLHVSNVMNVQTGLLYLDIPKNGRKTIYDVTGNWFPWMCVAYCIFGIGSGFIIKKKEEN